MKMKIYSIYDTAAAAYGSPVCAPTDLFMQRSFADAVLDPSTTFHRHPEQFVLYRVAEFDTENAVVTPLDPRPVITALEIKSASVNVPSVGESQTTNFDK